MAGTGRVAVCAAASQILVLLLFACGFLNPSLTNWGMAEWGAEFELRRTIPVTVTMHL